MCVCVKSTCFRNEIGILFTQDTSYTQEVSAPMDGVELTVFSYKQALCLSYTLIVVLKLSSPITVSFIVSLNLYLPVGTTHPLGIHVIL